MEEAKRIINGVYGRVWVGGELWAEVDKFEAKVSVNYEDVSFAGSGATFKKATGWTGEGSMTVKKIYSRVQRAMADSVRKGIYPRFEIMGAVNDPDAYGGERVALHDVTIGEFFLLQFETKKLGSEEIPFAFSDYEMVDKI
ncbi:Phage tail tube protein [Cohnella sp. OV330]|uniref:phage tail tube protein n=1 Tax=Cohnella sp. OV330 TaxID=1855288 RepID=UPI0008EA6792|nr:phage tail tube protein [Cohnella sp. OV330]SFB62587.1 Phage tail tube protein [Cohnella sp. OV330]